MCRLGIPARHHQLVAAAEALERLEDGRVVVDRLDGPRREDERALVDPQSPKRRARHARRHISPGVHPELDLDHAVRDRAIPNGRGAHVVRDGGHEIRTRQRPSLPESAAPARKWEQHVGAPRGDDVGVISGKSGLPTVWPSGMRVHHIGLDPVQDAADDPPGMQRGGEREADPTASVIADDLDALVELRGFAIPEALEDRHDVTATGEEGDPALHQDVPGIGDEGKVERVGCGQGRMIPRPGGRRASPRACRPGRCGAASRSSVAAALRHR